MSYSDNLTSLLVVILVGASLLPFACCYDCSNIIEVEREGLSHYVANVSFPSPHDFNGQWLLNLETDVEFRFLGAWNVWVESDPEAGNATLGAKEAVDVSEGDIVSFRFKLTWPGQAPKPLIISMVWEGAQLCDDDGKTIQEIKTQRRRQGSRSAHFITNGGRLIYRTTLG